MINVFRKHIWAADAKNRLTANIVSFKRFCFYNKPYSTDYLIIYGFENTKNKIANFGFDVLDYKEWANQKN